MKHSMHEIPARYASVLDATLRRLRDDIGKHESGIRPLPDFALDDEKPGVVVVVVLSPDDGAAT